MNPSRQLIPVADLGSHDLEIPTVLRARQAAAAYGYDHGLAQGAAIDAAAEKERRIAAHVLAAILDAPAGITPEGLSDAIAVRLSAACPCLEVR